MAILNDNDSEIDDTYFFGHLENVIPFAEQKKHKEVEVER